MFAWSVYEFRSSEDDKVYQWLQKESQCPNGVYLAVQQVKNLKDHLLSACFWNDSG